MKVISSKGCTTLRTLSQARVIATPDALGAEDMEALGENRVLSSGATRAVQLSLVRGRGGKNELHYTVGPGRVLIASIY